MNIRIVIAMILAVVSAILAPVQCFADSQVYYISDVMVGMGATADEAKKALTDAGFTVLDQNVNEGAGSALKTEKFVYIGYKTTTDPDEAITDLSVMNMNGGYSFADYEVLMNKYRDSQIRPFVDNFIAAIKEYRANYNSENEANRAKAQYAYTVLSRIYNDDCKNDMAQLLLNPSKEELGMSDKQYKRLSDDDKKTTVDLTTTLMQGNAQVVLLMEQTLAAAADTNETTWLERLSELGPEGLSDKYAEAGVRPTDANIEMASLYNDTAKAILSDWEKSRSALLDFEMSLAAKENGSESGGENADASDIINVGVADVETEEVDLLDPAGMMSAINGSLEASAGIAEKVGDNRTAALYTLLKETPYGDGTMYDFFTKPYAEVGGENISALYPMASTLTEGQIAAIDFLPLQTLLQIGVTSGESYVECGADNSDLLEVIEGAGQVSIFLNVNREIFGEKTALTSEALREKTLEKKGYTDPDTDLLGLSRLTAITWAATGVTLAVTIFSAINTNLFGNYMSDVAEFADALEEAAKTNAVMMAQGVKFMDNAGDVVDLTEQINLYSSFNIARESSNVVKVTYSFDIQAVTEGYNITPDAMRQLNDYHEAATQTITLESGAAKQIAVDADSAEEFLNEVKAQEEVLYKDNWTWKNIATVATVVVALLAVISIFMTAVDLYKYYNINYTPIPKYIVDEVDITTKDADGNQIVVRNDAAYYTVAKTNRPKTHEQYEALKDYADLNGDVGKEWLALYSVKQPGADPILADSLKVVTGSASIPEGYEKGIHMFGSKAAANLTDSHYTYNDKQNGIYVYFKTDVSVSSSDTASVFSGSTIALVGAGGALVGIALGAVAVVLIKRRKTAEAV